MKILIKYPSRNRKERFFQALDACVDNIQDKSNYHVAVTIDTDDTAYNNNKFVSRLNQYENISIGWGKSDSKVHAINRSMPDIDWDILVVLSDDQFFNFYGWDAAVRAEMKAHFPYGDGYLHFKEKDSQSALCVQTICDKMYYNRFGYIYHPDYQSLFCDNEQFLVAKMLGRYVYIPYELMVHKNPAYKEYGMERDEMFNRQQEIGYTIDEHTFNKRKAINFGLK